MLTGPVVAGGLGALVQRLPPQTLEPGKERCKKMILVEMSSNGRERGWEKGVLKKVCFLKSALGGDVNAVITSKYEKNCINKIIY